MFRPEFLLIFTFKEMLSQKAEFRYLLCTEHQGASHVPVTRAPHILQSLNSTVTSEEREAWTQRAQRIISILLKLFLKLNIDKLYRNVYKFCFRHVFYRLKSFLLSGAPRMPSYLSRTASPLSPNSLSLWMLSSSLLLRRMRSSWETRCSCAGPQTHIVYFSWETSLLSPHLSLCTYIEQILPWTLRCL